MANGAVTKSAFLAIQLMTMPAHAGLGSLAQGPGSLALGLGALDLGLPS